MATAGPSRPNGPQDYNGKGGPRSRYQANNRKFGTPLPILLPSSPLHPAHQPRHTPSLLSQLVFPSKRPIVPQCVGRYDPITRSVIVENKEDVEILFRRGFFGKGTLSRSEPTWKARRVDMIKGGESAAAEKIREKRRLERKQFKIDRAAAMLDAAKAAEAVITTGQAPSTQRPVSPSGSRRNEDEDEAEEGEREEEEDEPEEGLASPTLTSTSAAPTLIDVNTLTPQTFLVRPTRPDANRNRGKNAFRRKPKPKPVPASAPDGTSSTVGTQDATVERPSVETATRGLANLHTDVKKEEEAGDVIDESLVEELEHLQLSLEESWFLSTALGVLKIRDPSTGTFVPNSSALSLFLTPPTGSSPLQNTPVTSLHPDDPFLVSYVVYHHFRTLGWVVKSGVKFASDWLLYRRGPVFSHAAFSIVVIPVYMDHTDRTTSPYGNEDWYEERLSWKWMNTIMRVNSLVMKTVILVYVTIPARSSISDSYKLPDGSLNPEKNDMKTMLGRYTVREVSLQRFGPARRRD